MSMGSSSRRFILSAAVGFTALCATSVGAPAQDARALNARLYKGSADYVNTVSEATTAGLATGAIIGAIVGGAVSNNSGVGALAGTVIGGVAGSIFGNIAGKDVANKKAEYARREDSLDSSIARTRASNVKLASLVDVSTQLVAVRKSEIEQLNEAPDPAARRALASDLASEVKSLDAALAAANKTRAALRANIANYQGNHPPVLSAELKRTNEQLNALQARRDELDRMRKRL